MRDTKKNPPKNGGLWHLQAEDHRGVAECGARGRGVRYLVEMAFVEVLARGEGCARCAGAAGWQAR